MHLFFYKIKNITEQKIVMKTAVGLNDGGRNWELPFSGGAFIPPRGGVARGSEPVGVEAFLWQVYRRFFAPSKKWG